MNCSSLNVNGLRVIICGARPVTRKHCKFCRGTGRTVLASRLCDAEIRPGKTCDAGLCDHHARAQASGKDFCPLHNGEGVICA
jgi:hypothetical protein